MLVVGYAMLAVGAPLIAVIAGIALAAVGELETAGRPENRAAKKKSNSDDSSN